MRRPRRMSGGRFAGLRLRLRLRRSPFPLTPVPYMNKKELLTELEKLGMRPGRGLGQNFLLDGNLLDRIVRLGEFEPGARILEVGPGFGALTRRLLAAGAQVCAIEFDHRIAEYLRHEVSDPALELIEGDACRIDLSTLFGGADYRIIANLPYAISSVFIAKVLELDQLPDRMVFMLQREMAERLAAAPGTKAYGALSVRTQFFYRLKIEKIVPPEVFYPPPEVESAVLTLSLRGEFPGDPAICKRLASLARLLFSQRRKQVGKVLGGAYGRDRAATALAKCGLPPEIRPDRIDIAKFAALAAALDGDTDLKNP